jgi:hypothetical protein
VITPLHLALILRLAVAQDAEASCIAPTPDDVTTTAPAATTKPCPIRTLAELPTENTLWLDFFDDAALSNRTEGGRTWLSASQARALDAAHAQLVFVGSGFNDRQLAARCAREVPSCVTGKCVVLAGGKSALSPSAQISSVRALTILSDADSPVTLVGAAAPPAALSQFLKQQQKRFVIERIKPSKAALWLRGTTKNQKPIQYEIAGGQEALLNALSLQSALRGVSRETPKIPCYLAQ